MLKVICILVKKGKDGSLEIQFSQMKNSFSKDVKNYAKSLYIYLLVKGSD